MARDFVAASVNKGATSSAPASAVPLTLAVWFRPDDVATNQYLISIAYSAGVGDYSFGIRLRGDLTGDILQAFTFGSAFPVAATTTGVTSGTWHHAAAVFAAANSRRAFIDGGSAATETTNVTQAFTPDKLGVAHLARQTPPANYFDGRMAHAAVWNAALTDAEIFALSRHGVLPIDIRPASLVFWAPIWGGDSPEPDIIGRRSLTLTGTTAISGGPGRPYIFGRRSAGGTAVSAGALTIAVGQAVESDTAGAVAHARGINTSQATETDTANTITPLRARAVGQTNETDSANTVVPLRSHAIGQATETDSATTIAGVRVHNILQANETDVAQGVTALRMHTLGQATETDIAQPIVVSEAHVISQAIENNVANTITPLRRYAVSQANETDSGGSVRPIRVRLVSQATETDSAQAISYSRTVTISQALETQTAFSFRPARITHLGQANETNTANAIIGVVGVVVFGPHPPRIILSGTMTAPVLVSVNMETGNIISVDDALDDPVVTRVGVH